MSFSVYVTGLSMGLSLILAIGAQNAFVLRQGLRNEHVFAICLTCALSDAITDPHRHHQLPADRRGASLA